MLDKFLREVVVISVGKPAEEVAGLLNKKKHVNEFIIAKNMNLTINQTRNILYTLADNGLVSSIRKKDKRKGWYTYFWKIEVLKSLEFLEDNLTHKINSLNGQIKSRETKQFYICERCNIEVNEESALAMNFSCNECGEVFSLKDNSKVLKELNKILNSHCRELDILEKEIEKEKSKLDKIKVVEIKKLAKEKADKRASARSARKSAKKKLDKQAKREIAKKKVKKKTAKVKKKISKNKTKKGSGKKVEKNIVKKGKSGKKK